MDIEGDIEGESSTTVLISVVAVVGTLLFAMLIASFAIVVFVFIWRWRSKETYTNGVHRDTGENILLVEVQSPDEDAAQGGESAHSVQNRFYESVGTLKSDYPKIIEYETEVKGLEWDEVTLRVNFTGTPQPTVTWKFEDNSCDLEDDYAIEMNSDGSLLFVCIEKRHEGRYFFEVSNSLGSASGSIEVSVLTKEERETSGLKVDLSAKHLESNSVKVNDFGDYVEGLHSMQNSNFITQFESLPSCEYGRETRIGTIETNTILNRFHNIIVYDDSYIPLQRDPGSSEQQHEYINASYIDGYCIKKGYLATQGPLLGTVTDFWRLVWQEGVQIIAMVTNTKEHRSVKCEKYWPDSGMKCLSGSIQVITIEESVFSDYVIRKFNLSKGGKTHEVTQYHFISWPDHGVPEYAGPILNYLRRIKAQHKPSKGPILVHCSAGVGRTGTLIAIDIALAQAVKERQVDIPKIIVDMRKQRMKMVQTVDQYALIHDAVLESMICGETQIQPHDLCQAMKRLEMTDKLQSGKSGFEKQFEVLNQVSLKSYDVNCSTALINSTKNRSTNFLPPEEWRVKIDGGGGGYIHASFANGYKQQRGFIIAQSPMKNTLSDFVKMLYQKECGVVVMLCGCEEAGVEMCAQYWPMAAESSMEFGDFTVTVVSVDESGDTNQRVISITNKKSKEVHKVTQFQLQHWSSDGTCANPQALIDVIEELNSVQRRTGNKPIAVHGIDTVSRVGVFCSIVNAIEMCKTEGVVDVFQVVKALRIQKPGAVQTVDQYISIFDAVLTYLDS